MQYKKLGRTGLYVSRLCLGTMNFGDCTDKKSAPAANVAWVATSAKLASDSAVKNAKKTK